MFVLPGYLLAGIFFMDHLGIFGDFWGFFFNLINFIANNILVIKLAIKIIVFLSKKKLSPP